MFGPFELASRGILALVCATLEWCVMATLLAPVTSAWSATDASHRARVEGHGSPTIVFESGLGDTLDVWQQVQGRVSSSCARTFAYTRAGYPGSSRAHGTRDAATIVEELRAELERRDIAQPYVLVGHSMGGLYMQYFARTYPNEVAGLVLVDATHWQHLARVKQEASSTYTLVNVAKVLMTDVMRRELAGSETAGEQVLASGAPPVVPTVVLSSTRAALGETPAFRELAARLQDEIAAAYPGARHTRVEGSGHYIQRDRPEAVIDAIEEVAGCR